MFKTHRPGMLITFLIFLAILYGLLENRIAFEAIFLITVFLYLTFLFTYVGWITKPDAENAQYFQN